ncbi:N-acetylmuramoyl-L-alanine amidase [Afifella pfennigii]|uniref:N-acetylmuramoyl-L-alanine amidase n=1 Tax=Afifella pfennigii TaxID=209897 RepID=UPI00047E30D1|nr:N-acetylmuramoyl-L-alanine amidase [Afifella pfennigii]
MSLEPPADGAQWLASANFDDRGEAEVDILLLHYTGMEDEEAALAWLRDARSKVSCHYFVRADGRIVKMVGEEHRAWHAGKAAWAGNTDINARSIGIEIANWGHAAQEAGFALPPFGEAQLAALTRLCRDILTRHAIPPRRVLAHSDVAPGRKRDPGELFPWARLAAAGIGHHVEPAPLDLAGERLVERMEGPAVARLQALLALYGYGIAVTGAYDAATATVVAAFQRHFRPERVDGIADPSTRDTLQRLLAALP